MGDEEPRKRKTDKIEDALEPSNSGKDKGQTILIDGLPVPRMEPIEEVLSTNLFPEKMGMTTNIGGKIEPEVQRQATKYIRKNVVVFAFEPTDLKGIDPKLALH